MRRRIKTVIEVSIVFGILIAGYIAVYQGSKAVGFVIDRPAFFHEMIKLTGESLKDLQYRKEEELRAIQATVEELKEKKIKPNIYLLRELNRLKEDVQNIKKLRRYGHG